MVLYSINGGRTARSGIVIGIACGLAQVQTALASSDAVTMIQHQSNGAFVVSEKTDALPSRFVPRSPEYAPVDEGVLWHNYLEDAIYTTTGISTPAESMVAGTWLNPPQEVQLIPLEGTGTPLWTYPGNLLHVSASRDGDVIAAVDFDGGDTVTIYKWHAGSGTPDWSRIINTATLSSYRSVVVSPDGSTIALLVNETSDRGYAQLFYFDSNSSSPLGIHDCEDGTFGRNVSISADGSYIAFFAGANVYVMDRDAGSLRYSASAGASNDALAISGDGQYLAYGWTRLYVMQWNGTTYESLFNRYLSGYYLKHCAFASGTDTMATAWYPSSFLKSKLEVHDLPSSTPLWSFDYTQGTGAYQDIINDLALTADGAYIAAASWGDEGNTNPEIHVFSRDLPGPVLAVDTPGSMFDVDIAAASDGSVYLVAGGKHIHANDNGRGGDLYSVLVVEGCLADVNGDQNVDIDDLFQVLSAWGSCDECPEDINDDGIVDIDDVFEVLAAWGPC